MSLFSGLTLDSQTTSPETSVVAMAESFADLFLLQQDNFGSIIWSYSSLPTGTSRSAASIKRWLNYIGDIWSHWQSLINALRSRPLPRISTLCTSSSEYPHHETNFPYIIATLEGDLARCNVATGIPNSSCFPEFPVPTARPARSSV